MKTINRNELERMTNIELKKIACDVFERVTGLKINTNQVTVSERNETRIAFIIGKMLLVLCLRHDMVVLYPDTRGVEGMFLDVDDLKFI